ncbi:MAG: hypothetical protein NTU88_09100 [Armatimonadetes bacterium]|nr:hypothetical protein [Armatimonadota bacterium]
MPTKTDKNERIVLEGASAGFEQVIREWLKKQHLEYEVEVDGRYAVLSVPRGEIKRVESALSAIPPSELEIAVLPGRGRKAIPKVRRSKELSARQERDRLTPGLSARLSALPSELRNARG